MTRTIVVASLTFVLLGMQTGCSTMTKDKGSKKDSTWQSLQFWKKGYQQPAKMVVLWSHDVLTVAGQPPTRGFGGRIYFYNNKSQTIPVEGELVVHGFDESLKKAKVTPDHQADKRFRFTQEQFTEHFSESDLGASYSVWIPWDAVDGVQKEITLIPTFMSSKGEAVQGAPAKVILPGRTGPQSNSQTPVQTVAYEQASIPTVEGTLPQLGNFNPTKQSGGMRTTTIQVPSKSRAGGTNQTSQREQVSPQVQQMQQQLQAAAAQADANSLWAQARAQAIAEAFKPTEPVAQRPLQSFPAWSPNTAPLASSLAVSPMPVTPPNQSTNMQTGPGMQTGAPATQSTTRAAIPNGFESGPAPANSDEGLALPPGFQLSPRATAW